MRDVKLDERFYYILVVFSEKLPEKSPRISFYKVFF